VVSEEVCGEGEGRGDVRFAVTDVALHFLDGDLGLGLLVEALAAHLDTHDVAGDAFVAAFFMLVADDEDHIEAGQDGGLEIDVLAGRLEIVVAAEDRVGGCEDGGAGVEDGGDAGFGDGDGLLLHGFVDGDAVFFAHLVELVDAHYAAVGEDHGAAFEVEFAGVGVALDGGCETGG